MKQPYLTRKVTGCWLFKIIKAIITLTSSATRMRNSSSQMKPRETEERRVACYEGSILRKTVIFFWYLSSLNQIKQQMKNHKGNNQLTAWKSKGPRRGTNSSVQAERHHQPLIFLHLLLRYSSSHDANCWLHLKMCYSKEKKSVFLQREVCEIW